MALGENIKTRRTQLQMSQEYVADQLGISRQAVAKWEAGKTKPTAANLAELAALFEMNVSELVGPREPAEEQRFREEKKKRRQRDSRMFFGRWGAVILMNGGWDGYSSGLYSTEASWYWMISLIAGMILLFITSADMGKRHKLERPQIFAGGLMIFSIFLLPGLLPLGQAGLRYFLADIVTAVCAIFLALRYWRHIWKVRESTAC
ncbi:transcriptional regulator [Lachnoclostridium sp. An196]|uniref:helix-turn-helix domain-containing protein n=1 Tax=Lachnoclostridium sp. An196 TaxID=1965583 RepID=UPI000B399686|nr:helix-turn-helix transcriptional regulator [Lachnoclostridium sp. An196]OUP17090.1 transcriptional regulator [Lachnoclostridium sp. An196]